jgi:hypothetical protein
MQQSLQRDDSQRMAQIEAALASIRRAQKRQAILLWLVLGILLLWSAISVWFTVLANSYERQRYSSDQPATQHFSEASKYNEFSSWPVAQQVAEATVILVTRFDYAGDDAKQVIVDVLKQTHAAYTSFKVGDEYEKGRSMKLYLDGHPTGQVVFMVDSPARPAYSTTYHAIDDERVGRLRISLSQLRQLVRDTVEPDQAQDR